MCMAVLQYFATLPDGVIRLAAKPFQLMAPILHTHAKNQVFFFLLIIIHLILSINLEDLLNSMNLVVVVLCSWNCGPNHSMELSTSHAW